MVEQLSLRPAILLQGRGKLHAFDNVLGDLDQALSSVAVGDEPHLVSALRKLAGKREATRRISPRAPHFFVALGPAYAAQHC